MKSKRNEDIFQEELIVLDYLVHEYKKELKKTNKNCAYEYKTTKKARLYRLRLEIDNVLKSIENSLSMDWHEEV